MNEEHDGTKALPVATEFRPDLILLDMVMPKIDGKRLAAQLRAQPMLKDTPIIFLTASISNEGKWVTQEIGGCRALSKPISVHDLVEAIEQQLAGAVVAG